MARVSSRAASADAHWHLARIAEEAVTNARKHSSASRVTVDLALEGSNLVLRVGDDSRGFDPAGARDRGYGLTGMRERVAELNGSVAISAAPGQGVEIRAEERDGMRSQRKARRLIVGKHLLLRREPR